MDQIEKLYSFFLQSTGVTTDTRKVKQGNIFFALKGPNFNGNHFAEKALERGASVVVIDEKEFKLDTEQYILVDDVLESLQKLATLHRRKLDIPVIGITGSNGKTTTKELCYLVLSQKYTTWCTQGNLNNHIGVPLTLLQLKKEHEVAIIEMGANKLQDIMELCLIAEPNYGLITNIGKAHLEGFGSVEGIKKTKGELYDFVDKNKGVILINQNEAPLLEMSEDKKNKQFYGEKYPLHSASPFISFEGVGGEIVHTQLIGAYNHANILSALAVGKLFEVDQEKAIKAISRYTPENNRSQIIKKDNVTIVLDAYNANPTSMESALASFNKIESENKLVVLGEMLELGELSLHEHNELLKRVNAMNLKHAIVIGNSFTSLKEKYPTISFLESKRGLEKVLDLKSYSSAVIILIKGSRGNKLEEILDLI